MKSLSKKLWISLSSLIVGLALIALLIFFYLISPSGLQTITKITNHYYGNKVHIDQASGSLSSNVTIKQLNLYLGTKQVQVKHVNLRIQPWDLWLFHVSVNQMAADAIAIQSTQNQTSVNSESSSSSFSPSETLKKMPSAFAFPSWLTVHAIQLQNIQMTNGQSTQLSISQLNGQLTAANQQRVFTLQGQSSLPIPLHFKAVAQGTRDAYSVQFASTHSAYLVNGTLKVSPKQLTLNPFTIKKGAAYANITADYQLADTHELTLQGQFKQFPVFTQQLSGTIQATIHPTTGTHVVIKLQGNASTKTPQDQVTLHLKHQQHWSGQWKATIHELKQWFPFMKGSLNSEGHFDSHLWKTTGQISIARLQYQSNQLNQLDGSWSIDDTNATSNNHIKLNIQSLLISGFLMKHATLAGTGTLNQHTVNISMADAYNQTFSTVLQGKFDPDNQVWSGQIKQTQLQQSKSKLWKQSQSSQLSIDTNGITLSAFKLAQGNHYLSLAGNYQHTNPWSLNTSGNISGDWAFIENPILRSLSVNWSGQLSGKGKQLTTATLQSHFFAQLPPLTARAPNTLPVSVDSNLTLNNHKLKANIATKIAEHGALSSKVTLNKLDFSDPATLKDAAIQATTEGQINATALQSLIGHLSANVTSDGAMNLKSTITGTLFAPQINLQATHAGNIAIPLVGSNVTNISLNVHSNDKHIKPTLTLTYNKTPLTVSGDITIPASHDFDTNRQPWKSTWQFKAPTFTATKTQLHTVDVTPDLTMNCHNLKCHLKGKVSIPKATITINRTTSSQTLPTSDIQYTSSNGSDSANTLFTYHVLVSLGQSVLLNAYGFKGQAHGNITLIKENQTPLLLNGKISFSNATYTFQSNVLPITTAELAYTKSPPSNPAVQITAQRTVRVYAMPNTTQQNGNLMVGMHVSGFLTNPNIQLYSYPNALSKQDILSYLILGQASSTGGLLSTAAVFAFNKSSGGNTPNIVGNMKKMLGLSELGVENTNTYDNSGNVVSQQDQFVVGKKLFNKMYLRYTIGLGDADTLLMLIYQMTKHVSIQSTKGVQSSSHIGSAIDLMYQLSRP